MKIIDSKWNFSKNVNVSNQKKNVIFKYKGNISTRFFSEWVSHSYFNRDVINYLVGMPEVMASHKIRVDRCAVLWKWNNCDKTTMISMWVKLWRIHSLGRTLLLRLAACSSTRRISHVYLFSSMCSRCRISPSLRVPAKNVSGDFESRVVQRRLLFVSSSRSPTENDELVCRKFKSTWIYVWFALTFPLMAGGSSWKLGAGVLGIGSIQDDGSSRITNATWNWFSSRMT